MGQPRAVLASLVVITCWGLLWHRVAVAADQCLQLQSLIASLNAQRDAQEQRLQGPLCNGPARTLCVKRLQNLNAQIQFEWHLLQTCKNGTIPTSGIPAPPPHLPFDLYPQNEADYDHAAGVVNPRWDYLNGIPRNPTWAAQFYDGRVPNPQVECDAGRLSYHASDWRRCTSDPVSTNHDKCAGGGHVNWRPATHEGAISWSDHSGGDDDYDVNITRADRSLYTTANSDKVMMEFDSDETVDRYSKSHAWWKQLRSDVDSGASNPQSIYGTQAIVIGLVGLDYEHDSQAELHPLYMLGINYAANKWAFFLRNWGNEGYCSEGENYWAVNTISILFPNSAAIDGKIVSYSIWGTPTTGVSSYFLRGQGLVLEAQLPESSKEGSVFGDLTLEWTSPLPAAAFQLATPVVQPSMLADMEESRLSTALARLPAERRNELAQAEASRDQTRSRAHARPLNVQQLRARASIRRSAKAPPAFAQLSADTREQRARVALICGSLGRDREKFPELCARR